MVLVRFGHLVGLLLAILPSVAAYPFVLSSSDLENPFPALSDSPDLVLQSQRSRAVKFSRVVVFGDSLSDGGQGAWRYTNETWPADPHYFGHRFSNGRVYAEDVASALGLPITNFAVGGATTNNSLVAGYTGASSTLVPVPSILDQISTFTHESRKGKTSKLDRRTLFIIYGGANNVLFDPEVTAEETLHDLKSAVAALASLGGTHFLVPSLPPLGSSYPFSTLVPAYTPTLKRLCSELHAGLARWAENDPRVRSPHAFSFFSDKLLEDPEAFGFDSNKLGESCLRGVFMEVPGGVTVSSDPSKYVWWDEYHPTKRVHALIASVALKTINRAGDSW